MNVIASDFIHPADKAALENLESIPGFPLLVKKIMSIGLENFFYGTNMASNIRLSQKQLPEIYNHLPPICKKLGIAEPELYLEMNPVPNAYTFGDTRIFITLTSGLIEHVTSEELEAVIAHECGHIICRHVLYHTIADIIKNGAELIGLLGTLSVPIQLALFYWYRMSELSSDRCAAVITSPNTVASTMARLAGGPKSITANIDFDEWAKQADEYERIRKSSTWNQTLQTFAVMNSDHPFSAVRVREILNWGKTENYSNMIERLSTKADVCPYCGAFLDKSWRFCSKCGNNVRSSLLK